MNKKINIIVAMGANNEIGLDGKMPWNHFSDDLKRFKSITMGNTIIMGRKTYESIGSKPLIGRKNIVLSHDNDYLLSIVGGNVYGAVSIPEALDYFCEDVFCIGGSQIYRQTIDLVDKIYITQIYKSFEADTFFPKLDDNYWHVSNIEHYINDTFQYDFIECERI